MNGADAPMGRALVASVNVVANVLPAIIGFS